MSFKDVSSAGLITVLLQSSGVAGRRLSSQWAYLSSVDPLRTGRHLLVPLRQVLSFTKLWLGNLAIKLSKK